MGAEPIRFGPFVLDRGNAALFAGGKPVAIGQRGYALLEALAVADGPVSKSSLMEAAWPGTIVEEGNLTVQIAALRKALGPRPDGQEWIVTVPRVGYRLLRQLEAPAAPSPMPGLAVMPFQGSGDDDHLADGLVDDLITGLGRFSKFSVTARSSVFAYKSRNVDVRRVAEELGASYVLEGSVRKAGTRLRITAQLADGTSGTQLFSRQYDGDLADLSNFQDKVVEEIVGWVEPQLELAEIERARRRGADSLTAHDRYLQAVHKWKLATEADNRTAVDLIEQAILAEPGNATYLIAGADILQNRFGMGWLPIGDDDAQRAKDYINRALTEAPDDADVVGRAGNMLLQNFRDYDRGLALVRRAIALNPFDAFVVGLAGVAELHCGSLDAAEKYFERSAKLNPKATAAYFPLAGIAHVEIVRGRYEEALARAEQAYALNREFDCALWMLTSANALLGRMEPARRFCAELRQLSPASTIARIRAGQPAKIPGRIEAVLDGLRLAGLAENDAGA